MPPLVAPLDPHEHPDLGPLLDIMREASGYVPNSVLTMARVPGLPEAFVTLARTVLGPGQVDRELKALVALMASTAAGCRYCQAHTATTATKLGGSEARAGAVWEFETSPLFTEPDRAALRLARDAAGVPNTVGDSHHDEMRAGFSENQTAEIVAVISLFGYLNRWNDTMGTTLEDVPASVGGATLAVTGWNAGKHSPR